MQPWARYAEGVGGDFFVLGDDERDGEYGEELCSTGQNHVASFMLSVTESLCTAPLLRSFRVLRPLRRYAQHPQGYSANLVNPTFSPK